MAKRQPAGALVQTRARAHRWKHLLETSGTGRWPNSPMPVRP